MLRWFVIAAELAVFRYFWRTAQAAGADVGANGAGTVGA